MILEGTHHTDPTTFGEDLRRKRERAGVSLDDICDETKISRRVLEALEDGRFELLPDRVFSRSFVRQIADAIGDNRSHMLEDFDAAWTAFEQDSGQFRVDFLHDSPPSRSIRWRFWFPISIGFAILMSAAVVILSGSDPGEESLVESPNHTLTAQRPPVTPTGAPTVAAVAAVRPQPEPTSDDPISLAVRVDPAKECWIHYRDREGRTEQRLLPGGSDVRLQLKGPVKLTVGNAGAATLMVGGVEYSDLGVPGQVVHTEVSRHGVRTLGVGDPS
jgi:cytoskeletal protein RodZ